MVTKLEKYMKEITFSLFLCILQILFSVHKMTWKIMADHCSRETQHMPKKRCRQTLSCMLLVMTKMEIAYITVTVIYNWILYKLKWLH